ncbi:MAG: universal stress protein [Desulfobacteraceae bacterium]|jgi:ACR3 family arsenite efflux pump ArsB/nucleotide-binding universal stress UspA family protein
MWNLLGKINKNLIIAIPVMMAAGFLYGLFFPTDFLKNLIVPLTFLMVYPMMVTLKIKKVLEGGDFKAQVATQVINFAIVPFAAYGLSMIFFKDNSYLALGLVLAGLVPTSGMTISWTGFAKGNVEAAVKMTVVGLTLGSLATPFYLRFLMGTAIEVQIGLVIKQILVIVFIPMIAGYLTQQALVKKFGQKEFQQILAPRFPSVSTLGVVGIVFVAIALKAKSIAASPQMLLYIMAPLVLIYLFNFIVSTLVGRIFFNREDAIALVYGSVMRNLSIALAISINAFGKEGSSAALVIALAYIIQVQSAAWYVRFTDKIFGAASRETGSEIKGTATDKDSLDSGRISMVPEIKKILYATDLSESARYAVRYACSIGNRYQSLVTVLHVVPDVLEEYSMGAGMDLLDQASGKKRDDMNKVAVDAAREQIRQRIQRTSVQVAKEIPSCPISEQNIRVEVGDPVKTITSIAENENYDMVIMGTHGHGKLSEVMIGSISSGVIKHCTKPVLVVQLPS